MIFAGTPTYMAPELFVRKGYDEKIDVFSFGTMAWEILEKEVPYDGLDPKDIMQKVCSDEKLEFKKTGIPKPLANLITQCRASDPKKRPSMKDVLHTLDGISG